MDNLQIINKELNKIGYSPDVLDKHPYKNYHRKVVLLKYHDERQPCTRWVSYVEEKDAEHIIKEIALHDYCLCQLLGVRETPPNEIKFKIENGKLVITLENVHRYKYRGRSWIVQLNVQSTQFSHNIRLSYWTDEIPYEMYEYVDGVLCTRRNETMSRNIIDEYIAEEKANTEYGVKRAVKDLDEKIKRIIENKERGLI